LRSGRCHGHELAEVSLQPADAFSGLALTARETEISWRKGRRLQTALKDVPLSVATVRGEEPVAMGWILS